MADKSVYMLICFCIIILNMLIVRLYFETDEFETFIGDANRSAQFHPYYESHKSNKTHSKNASFIKFGGEFVPVWKEEHDTNYNSLERFSSRYLKSLKNPCWLEFVVNRTDSELFNLSTVLKSFTNNSNHNRYNKPMKFVNLNGKPVRTRCLPYFMIIGQPKCGTTDLYFRVSQHPQVIPSLVKGPHWWTRKFFGSSSGKPVSFNSYIDLFSSAADAIQSSIEENYYETQEQIVTGEASPSTLWDTSGVYASVSNISDGSFRKPEDSLEAGVCRYLNSASWVLCIPERIKALLPNIRLIVILRNPTDRLYSDFLYFHRFLNKSKELFHHKVKEAILMFRSCSDKSSAETCAYSEELKQRMEVRLHVGLYVVYLRNWMRVFKMNQLHVIRFEDYIFSPKDELTQLFRFLQLNDLNPNEEELIWSSSPLNRNPLVKKYGPMLPRTRRLLDEFFTPFNHQLSRLLNNSKFLWQGGNAFSRPIWAQSGMQEYSTGPLDL